MCIFLSMFYQLLVVNQISLSYALAHLCRHIEFGLLFALLSLYLVLRWNFIKAIDKFQFLNVSGREWSCEG